jgi:L-cysteine:1D-myo-inositol 2-amino-2-deoxy-alpha-D-glucopyranoside ligase
MHQAMVRMDGAKMSKSLGNLVFVSDLRQVYDPRVIRLGIVANHYRTEWEWNAKLMPAAAERLDRWLAAGQGEGAVGDVRASLDRDLDTPAAVAAIDAAAERGEGVSAAAMLLGVDVGAGSPALNLPGYSPRISG